VPQDMQVLYSEPALDTCKPCNCTGNSINV